MSRLDTLPPELLFTILSYTEPVLNPALQTHALNALAATNKQLNAIVEEYARNLLKRHANITPPKNSRTFTCRRKLLGELCQYCWKKSMRRACFYPSITCCRSCDRSMFEKVTMTQATHDHHLSKLDLFTPNALHPSLAPLPLGTYPVMGGVATMLCARAVLARRDYIYTLLGARAHDAGSMRVRPAAHNRIMQHLGIAFDAGRGEWVRVGVGEREGGPKSMRTREGRVEYVKRGLQREWAALKEGKEGLGMSKEAASEIE